MPPTPEVPPVRRRNVRFEVDLPPPDQEPMMRIFFCGRPALSTGVVNLRRLLGDQSYVLTEKRRVKESTPAAEEDTTSTTTTTTNETGKDSDSADKKHRNRSRHARRGDTKAEPAGGATAEEDASVRASSDSASATGKGRTTYRMCSSEGLPPGCFRVKRDRHYWVMRTGDATATTVAEMSQSVDRSQTPSTRATQTAEKPAPPKVSKAAEKEEKARKEKASSRRARSQRATAEKTATTTEKGAANARQEVIEAQGAKPAESDKGRDESDDDNPLSVVFQAVNAAASVVAPHPSSPPPSLLPTPAPPTDEAPMHAGADPADVVGDVEATLGDLFFAAPPSTPPPAPPLSSQEPATAEELPATSRKAKRAKNEKPETTPATATMPKVVEEEVPIAEAPAEAAETSRAPAAAKSRRAKRGRKEAAVEEVVAAAAAAADQQVSPPSPEEPPNAPKKSVSPPIQPAGKETPRAAKASRKPPLPLPSSSSRSPSPSLEDSPPPRVATSPPHAMAPLQLQNDDAQGSAAKAKASTHSLSASRRRSRDTAVTRATEALETQQTPPPSLEQKAASDTERKATPTKAKAPSRKARKMEAVAAALRTPPRSPPRAPAPEVNGPPSAFEAKADASPVAVVPSQRSEMPSPAIRPPLSPKQPPFARPVSASAPMDAAPTTAVMATEAGKHGSTATSPLPHSRKQSPASGRPSAATDTSPTVLYSNRSSGAMAQPKPPQPHSASASSSARLAPLTSPLLQQHQQQFASRGSSHAGGSLPLSEAGSYGLVPQDSPALGFTQVHNTLAEEFSLDLSESGSSSTASEYLYDVEG